MRERAPWLTQFSNFQLELANSINSDGALSDKENIVRRMKNQVKHSPERMLNVSLVLFLLMYYFTIVKLKQVKTFQIFFLFVCVCAHTSTFELFVSICNFGVLSRYQQQMLNIVGHNNH